MVRFSMDVFLKESVMNNFFAHTLQRALLAGFCLVPVFGYAFNSGSTGADGAFSPTVNTVLDLPPSGVFNFTTVNIPSGVTVTFRKNASNTPVVWLATGDVTIAGSVVLSGTSSAAVGAAGNGFLGDDGVPGVGGVGGYDGGRGGTVGTSNLGGAGLGPGAGTGGTIGNESISNRALGGAGGGFGSAGACSQACQTWGNGNYNISSVGGVTYGSNLLLPLIGGSGGGGGAAGVAFAGSGGGGGAILIASSGTVAVTGTVLADGASSGASAGVGSGGTGGGGSGGAIRIVATAISGDGSINAAGGSVGGQAADWYAHGGQAGVGRIRLEAETFTRTAATTPAYSTSIPGPLFIASAPTLTIASVAGVAAPLSPTGNADITFPADTPNPVTVVLNTTGVPPGNTVKFTVTPAYGAPIVVTSAALTGTTANASTSVSVTLPSGPSTMSAITTYTIVVALAQGEALSTFAQGERVEKINVVATLGAPSTATLVTVSGKQYPAPAAALALAGING
jgi:hypothetical protein